MGLVPEMKGVVVSVEPTTEGSYKSIVTIKDAVYINEKVNGEQILYSLQPAEVMVGDNVATIVFATPHGWECDGFWLVGK